MAPPVIDQGMIKNYVYLRVRVNLSKGLDATQAREKEPYLRDALIHAVYQTPFTGKETHRKLVDTKLGLALA